MRSILRLSGALLLIALAATWPAASPSAPWRSSASGLSGQAAWWLSPATSAPLAWLWTVLADQASATATTPTGGGLPSAPVPPSVPTRFAYAEGLSEQDRSREAGRIAACLSAFPERLRAPLDHVAIEAGVGNPRALSDGRRIIIHSVPLSDAELCNVVAHEMGHVIDLGYLRGEGFEASPFRDGDLPVLTDDLSVAYYALTWADERTPLSGTNRMDSPTGYARSNPFEDFAEAVGLYVRNGRYFRSLLPSSPILERKYAFLRDTVFRGVEYDTGREALNMNARKFDGTLVGIQYY